jgi:hypothetical protein
MANETSKAQNGNGFDLAKFAEQLARFLFGIVKELAIGLRYNLIPWNLCLGGGVLFSLLFLWGVDRLFFDWIYLGKLYPTRARAVLIYWVFLSSASFWMWASFRWAKKQGRSRELDRVFSEGGLRSIHGRLPSLVFEKNCDDFTTQLRVTVAGANLDKFKKAKSSIESNMKVFIDDIRENRSQGTIDIIYAKQEMPTDVVLKSPTSIAPCRFLIGETRASVVWADLRKVPHLLIAGQTGGGKSSFLRQFTVTQLLNCKHSHFILIDLKEGLESHLFEGLPNVEVYQDVAKASIRLAEYEEKLPKKLALIKEQGCVDFDGYIASEKPKTLLEREFIIVDEAAELFLAGDKTRASDVQKARRILSDVARRGRAAAVHLIIATQRPDSRSLDPQVKANLPGALCFQMANDASSITVLGNGKATDLPPIPGRGLWKVGSQMIEVQTPFLSYDAASDLLKSLKK